MTEYFDRAWQNLQVAVRTRTGDWVALATELDAIDIKLVEDVSYCSEFEGFPEDLRESINRIILKRSAAGQPVNAQGPSYETVQEHAAGIENMIGDLHTVFHEVAERRLKGFSDDPRTPLRILYARAEERREGLVQASNP